ncbi:hypothetical protein IQ230_16325 [Gloeocapsopsis crepidinum LEGE 06123]|uniref:Uncharacterized protein n=1 Tax=Gloeocapsopsis crepidinum LEGE 06123 TaxID=588587 RepID=A0ABR9UUC6_9CHRO|nr:hypothetical protein [Gloeocapsopsis crepidinum]MBE9191887.1 hypothetical protein [Gloeocapsopsis crepidinum LEGE 06123]
MKPDFKAMPLAELRDYVKERRNDDEATYELFVNRRDPNAKKYPAPLDEAGIKTMEEAFRRKIQGKPEL